MSPCRCWQPLLETFVDGELPPDKVLEVEQHLEECSNCTERVRFEAALRSSVRRCVRAATCSTPALEQRICAALAAERQRERERERAIAWHRQRDEHSTMLPWRTIVPVAAAAALTLTWAISSDQSADDLSQQRHRVRSSQAQGDDPLLSDELARRGLRDDGDDVQATRSQRLANIDVSPVTTPTFAATMANVDQLIDEFVNHHAQAPSPAITEPGLVQHLEPEVGVPVKLPSLQQYGARWEGGDVMRNHRAASLSYRLGSHRVTLYVYNSARFPLRATLEPRVVRNEPVYVGTRRGYSIAAVERRGLGYAVTADLDDRESAELVASIY
jgi:anti-sigma factor RsiW